MGFQRNGDNIAVTLSAEDFAIVDLAMAHAAGEADKRAETGNPFAGPVRDAIVRVANAMHEGDPGWIPYDAGMLSEAPAWRAQKAISDWYTRNGGHASVDAAIDRTVEECQELNLAPGATEIREECADPANLPGVLRGRAGRSRISGARRGATRRRRQRKDNRQGFLDSSRGEV
jgi:hypothetical protein